MTDSIIASININKSQKRVNVLDVPANKWINQVGIFFKEKNVIKIPKWGCLVKCSHANEISPLDADFLYYKAAAIARYLYLTKSKSVGVGSLKTVLGKKKRRGSQPPIFMRAGGRIIRELVKQLKTNGYVENYGTKDDNTTFGMVLTKQGRTELDKIAARVMKQ